MDYRFKKYIKDGDKPNWFEIITSLVPFVNIVFDIIFKKRESKLNMITKLVDLYPPDSLAENLIQQIKIVLNEKDIS